MTNTISLAREALILFLLSLPEGCKFNVCSYGSKFSFLFDNERSVDYNDENCQIAISKVKEFEADFGGTDIYSPLKKIYDMNTDCKETHTFLLTDGAVLNTSQIVRLVASNSSLERRLHTFGVGSGADETLIRKCASKGFGNFYFIQEMSEIEYKVIDSLTNIQLNYKVLHNITLFDKDGNQIETNWLKSSAEPLKNAETINLLEILPDNLATHFALEILDPNKNKSTKVEGDIMPTKNQSLSSIVALKEIEQIKE